MTVAGMVFPIPGGPWSFRDSWGEPRGNGRTHKGTDIAAPHGTPLVAIEAGQVSYGFDTLSGHYARLVPTSSPTVAYVYCHMPAGTRQARAVGFGEQIGTVGNTGNSFGPHLHLSYIVAGTALNPYPILRRLADATPPPPPAPPEDYAVTTYALVQLAPEALGSPQVPNDRPHWGTWLVTAGGTAFPVQTTSLVTQLRADGGISRTYDMRTNPEASRAWLDTHPGVSTWR